MSDSSSGSQPRDRRRLGDVLDREAIRTGPVDAIRQPGHLCATGELAERLERVEAIVHALSGPGRIELVDGLEVAVALLEEIRFTEEPRP